LPAVILAEDRGRIVEPIDVLGVAGWRNAACLVLFFAVLYIHHVGAAWNKSPDK
jgi:hypothetical protein